MSNPAAADDFSYAIGTAIHRQRKTRRISQTNLARKIGISNFTLSHLERGMGRITVKSVFDIARGLNISPLEIFSEVIVEQHSPRNNQELTKLRNEVTSLRTQLQKISELTTVGV